jgi:hypothetical protein
VDPQARPSPLVGQLPIRPEERPGLVSEQPARVTVARVERDSVASGEPVRGDLPEEGPEAAVEVERVRGPLDDVMLDAL